MYCHISIEASYGIGPQEKISKILEDKK